MLRNLHFSHIVQNDSGVVKVIYILFMNNKRTQMHNINFITCPKAEI